MKIKIDYEWCQDEYNNWYLKNPFDYYIAVIYYKASFQTFKWELSVPSTNITYSGYSGDSIKNGMKQVEEILKNNGLLE